MDFRAMHSFTSGLVSPFKRQDFILNTGIPSASPEVATASCKQNKVNRNRLNYNEFSVALPEPKPLEPQCHAVPVLTVPVPAQKLGKNYFTKKKIKNLKIKKKY
jgi:hypothetical protein